MIFSFHNQLFSIGFDKVLCLCTKFMNITTKCWKCGRIFKVYCNKQYWTNIKGIQNFNIPYIIRLLSFYISFGIYIYIIKQYMYWISINKSLFSRNKIGWILNRMVIGYEGDMHDNCGESAQTAVKTRIMVRKFLLCHIKPWKEIKYYEQLPDSQALNLDLFCELDHLKEVIA